MGQIEYIPRRQVEAHLTAGWRLIKGHTYALGDWAVLMRKPETPEPLTARQIRTMAAIYNPIVIKNGNKSRGAVSAQSWRSRKKFAELEM